jgi:hypothetical protein
MNPKCLLTPTLSSFLGRRGRRSLGLHTVQGFNARNWLRGILTPALSPAERVKLWHGYGDSLIGDLIQRSGKSRLSKLRNEIIGSSISSSA